MGIFFQYAGAVMKQWLPLILGVFGTFPWWARALLSPYLQGKVDKIFNPSAIKRFGICCVIISFAWANFNAWEDQYTQVLTLKQNFEIYSKPKFQINLFQTLIGHSANKTGVQYFVNLGITNIGVPSIATNWRMNVKVGTQTISCYPTIIPDGYTIKEKKKLIARFSKNNLLQEKTVTPIQQGAVASGWLRFDFPNANYDQMQKALKTISIHDIYGVEYSANLDTSNTCNEPKYYVGSGDYPFDVKQNKKRSK
jgi:hypothetical protein